MVLKGGGKSTYSFAENDVIRCIDIESLEKIEVNFYWEDRERTKLKRVEFNIKDPAHDYNKPYGLVRNDYLINQNNNLLLSSTPNFQMTTISREASFSLILLGPGLDAPKKWADREHKKFLAVQPFSRQVGCNMPNGIINIYFKENMANFTPNELNQNPVEDGDKTTYLDATKFLNNLSNKKFIPGFKINIIGYTNSIGSNDYNNNLSQKRANSIADYLKNRVGFNDNQIHINYLGEDQSMQMPEKQGTA